MGLSIIHFSDIHIKNKNDIIMKRVDKLKMACASALPSNDDVVIAISGDIAFSGNNNQYKIASDLINDITQYIKQQKSSEVHYVFVPGNHDCDFSRSDSVRESLVTNIKTDDIDKVYFNQVESVQEAYKCFAQEYNVICNDIAPKVEIEIDNNKILFLLINTSWMSELEELPGKLIMPTNLFSKINSREYKIVFSVFHHPINWLNPDYKTHFINYIRSTTDIILLGHEHQRDEYKTSGVNWSVYEYHGKELQDNNSEESAFSVFNFSSDFQTFDIIEYSWDNSSSLYRPLNQSSHNYHKNISIYESVYQPNSSTIALMNDLGIALNHFAKEDVYLSDIFVWPEVQKIDFNNDVSYGNKIHDKITDIILEDNLTIIIGSTSCGKTSLAKMIALNYVDEDICCIFVKGSLFKSKDSKSVFSIIEGAFMAQYSKNHVEDFRQLPKEKKVIIIDDFDDMPFYGDRRNEILKLIYDEYGKIIIFMKSNIEIPSLLSSTVINSLKEMPMYEILPMGNKKRKELIQKWYFLNEDYRNEEELENRIESSILFVDKFIGNGTGIIPAIPIFILAVLQNRDAMINSSFNGSQYGFLYESLIQSSLSKILSSYKQPGSNNIDISLVSQLAFFMLQKKKTYFIEDELEAIVDKFNDDMKLDISKDNLLKRMCDANIFYKDISEDISYKFRYPYIFYYFVGHYIAYHYKEDEVKSKVEYMSSRLYNEEYGNIIIFVCHFANNTEVIESILLNAYNILDEYESFDFQKSNPVFDDIQATIEALLPACICSNDEVSINQDSKLSNLDDAGINDGRVIESDNIINDDINDKDNIEKDLAAISAALKTMDVLGQILQNYPGDIDGKFKVDIIDEIHKLGMRSVQAVIATMGYIEEDLICFVVDYAKKENKSLSRDEIIMETRRIITVLLSRMVRGMIAKIARTLDSKFLLKPAEEVLRNEGSISSMLVLQDLKINCLKELNAKEILRVKDYLQESKNRFAYCVLSSIIANYLSFNKCDYKVRSSLCQQFNLSQQKTIVQAQRKLLS